MSEQRSSPPETPAPAGPKFNDVAASIAPPAGAVLDDGELSDDDLEHVVGGLARAWFPPETQPPRDGDAGGGGGGGAGAGAIGVLNA